MRVKFIVAALALLILLVLIVRRSHEAKLERETSIETNSNQVSGSTESTLEVSNVEAKTVEQAGTQKQNLNGNSAPILQTSGFSANSITQKALMFWTNAILEMSNTINQPVTFFGKVVDENEAPLKGATVKLTCFIYPEKSSDTNVATGDEGLFAVSNLNAAILIVHAAKEGYRDIPKTNQLSFNYYSPGGGGFRSDPNNPVVFRLRKHSP
jgi:hypothetical protein